MCIKKMRRGLKLVYNTCPGGKRYNVRKIVFYTNVVEEHESLIPKHISGISFRFVDYAATKCLNIHGHWPISHMDQICFNPL